MKKYLTNKFDSFLFFYSYVGKIFFLLISTSIVIAFLDAIGLSLFIPLLKSSSGTNIYNEKESLGDLKFILEFFEWANIPNELIYISMLIVSVFVVKGIITYTNKYLMFYTNVKLVKGLRLALVTDYKTLSYKGYLQSDTATISNTLTVEITRINNAYSNYTKMILRLFTVSTYLYIAFSLDYRFTSLVLITSLPFGFVFGKIANLTKSQSLDLADANQNFQQLILQQVNAFKYFKSTGSFKSFYIHVVNAIERLQFVQMKLGYLSAVASSIREPVVIFCVFAAILIHINVLGGSMTSLILILVLLWRGINEVMQFQVFRQSFLSSIGSMNALQNLHKFLIDNHDGVVHKDENSSNIYDKQLSVKNISFQYNEDDSPVLNNVSLDLDRNESIAIIGTSGSGKSTLLDVITGIINPSNGEITLDGEVLNHRNKASWQSNIGMVSQEPVIFQDTLFNNVSLWGERTKENEEKCIRALRVANAYDFIDQKKNGIDEQLGDKGISLSGGQKQRVAIAREIYKSPKILILDEATSALDSETELLLQENIKKLKGKVTLIIVAHRLSTIKDIQKVIILSKGKVLEYGSYNELIQNPNSELNRMLTLQS